MPWIVLLLALSICSANAWICGNNGQCRCTSSGEVMCDDIKAAPYFMKIYREGKRLTLKTSGGFNVDSLKDTAGFDRVMIIGLSMDQCSRVTETYPSIMCVTTTTTTTTMSRPFTTMTGPPLTRPAVTETRPAAGSDATDQRTGPALRTTVNGMLIWTVVSGAIGAILTACILAKDYIFLRCREIVVTIGLRLLGRLLLIYIWNINMVIAIEQADERNLVLAVLVRMTHWMIRTIERRNGNHIANAYRRPVHVPRPAPEGNARPAVVQPAAAHVPERRPVGVRGRRDLRGLDLNNILPARLRNRNVDRA